MQQENEQYSGGGGIGAARHDHLLCGKKKKISVFLIIVFRQPGEYDRRKRMRKVMTYYAAGK